MGDKKVDETNEGNQPVVSEDAVDEISENDAAKKRTEATAKEDAVAVLEEEKNEVPREVSNGNDEKDKEDYEVLSKEAERLFRDDRLLEARRVLRKVDEKNLTDQQKDILRLCDEYQAFMNDVTDETEGEETKWKKLGEKSVRGCLTDVSYVLTRHSSTHVKVDARIITLMHRSLLSPVLAVFNESDLYHTWLPSWKIPKILISESERLRQIGRVSQVVRMRVGLQWPLYDRELMLFGLACDDIDATGTIAVKINTLKEGDDDWFSPEEGVHRVHFSGGLLFRRPSPELIRRARKEGYVANDVADSELVATSYMFEFENRGAYFPDTIVRFSIDIGITVMWGMVLRVAEEVRDGKHADFNAIIASKRETLYDWIDERVKVLCSME